MEAKHRTMLCQLSASPHPSRRAVTPSPMGKAWIRVGAKIRGKAVTRCRLNVHNAGKKPAQIGTLANAPAALRQKQHQSAARIRMACAGIKHGRNRNVIKIAVTADEKVRTIFVKSRRSAICSASCNTARCRSRKLSPIMLTQNDRPIVPSKANILHINYHLLIIIHYFHKYSQVLFKIYGCTSMKTV